MGRWYIISKKRLLCLFDNNFKIFKHVDVLIAKSTCVFQTVVIMNDGFFFTSLFTK